MFLVFLESAEVLKLLEWHVVVGPFLTGTGYPVGFNFETKGALSALGTGHIIHHTCNNTVLRRGVVIMSIMRNHSFDLYIRV